MENDLLFTLIYKDDWKEYTKTGYFEPKELSELGHIRCFEGKFAERMANQFFNESEYLLLIVIDPLRIHEPMKRSKEVDIDFTTIHGKFSIDAIIDRISLKKSKKGEFNIRIKHFD